MRTCGKKKLAKLVLAALLSTGGVLFSPLSVASAADVTVDADVDDAHYVYNGDIHDESVWDTHPAGEQSGHSATIKAIVNTDVYGGYSSDGEANNNRVIIDGGVVPGSIWGGFGQTNAKGNTVTIAETVPEGTVFDCIHGASIFYESTGFAQDNTVNVLAKVVVNTLMGGEAEAGTSSGNTLNIGAVGVRAGYVDSFQNINFFLPEEMTTEDVMLNVTGTANVDGAKIGVMAKDGTFKNLKEKDKVKLLSAQTLNGTVTKTTDTITAPESLTKATTVDYEIDTVGNDIVATINKVNESGGGDSGDGDINQNNLKSPVETRAATVTLLNAGADMLASQGFVQAANAVAIEAAEQAKNGATGAPVSNIFTPFAAFGGSSLRAESGSHVNTKGFGINVGFAKEFANSQGKLLFGPVVEYGGGKYDSYNDDVHGDGGSHYWGFGLMARQTNHDGFYYEGSVRYGRVTSDYGADLDIGGIPVHASYDSASNYWAAHLGLGKVFTTGKQDTVDTYLKYFYSHQGGDDTSIAFSGEKVAPGLSQEASFDSVDSNRIRIGARYTHKINEMNSLYGGLAYQYEFGGEARAHYGADVAPSPSVKGSSGMLELGWQVKPGGPVTIDLGVTGWAGKQRGGSVQLGATWTF